MFVDMFEAVVNSLVLSQDNPRRPQPSCIELLQATLTTLYLAGEGRVREGEGTRRQGEWEKERKGRQEK